MSLFERYGPNQVRTAWFIPAAGSDLPGVPDPAAQATWPSGRR
jgi:hypothetical protein